MRTYTHAEVQEDIRLTESIKISPMSEFDNVRFIQLYSEMFGRLHDEMTVTDLNNQINEYYNNMSNILPEVDELPSGDFLMYFYTSTSNPGSDIREYLKTKLTKVAVTNNESEGKALSTQLMHDENIQFIVMVSSETMDVSWWHQLNRQPIH